MMKGFAGYRYLLSSLEKVIDFFLNGLIFYGCYRITAALHPGTMEFSFQRAIALIGIVCFSLLFFYTFNGVYAPLRMNGPMYYIGRLFLINMVFGAALAIFAMLFVDDALGTYLRWIFSSVAVSLLVLVSKKVIMLAIRHEWRSKHKNIKKVLLVTDSQEMADSYMEEILRHPQYGYEIIGYVGNLNVVGLEHLGTTGDLDRVLTENRPDEVVVAYDTVRKKVVTRHISVCNNHCVKVLVVPAICGYFKSPRQISNIGNLPMIDIRRTPLDDLSNRFAKRAVDIVGSIALIILTSPLMLFTAIGVKFSSPGPILFKQKRIGKNNQEFTMLKFRSMRENTSEETGWTTENDPRKTRFGAFIRMTALDELPQFFNVLKGDMSLVGPRPEVPYYVEKFRKEIPLYMLKHTLRPGITGLAQIEGLRGDTSIEARIDEDINYIENWSFWGDIRILLLTPFHTFNRHERYAEVDAFEGDLRRRMALSSEEAEEEDDTP